MRVGIIQSSYIPWRGYFDFIRSVDLFMFLDDVQYPRGRSWRNRNQVKTPTGLKWLTVPVPSKSYSLAIDEVRMANTGRPWRDAHRGVLENAFRGAPHAEDALSLWEHAVNAGDSMLSDLNARLTKSICTYLEIATPITKSREYGVPGSATDRLINLVKAVGGTTYLSGPAAKDYLDEDAFRRNGLRLEYKSYDYAPYPQLWGPFAGAVTVLDLVANLGRDASQHLNSRAADIVAVP